MLNRFSIFILSVFMLMGFISSSQIIHTRIDTISNVSCNQLTLGEVTVTVTNFNHPPYTFQWSNGQHNTGQSSTTATGLTAGTYTLTITDNQDGDYGSLVIEIFQDECDVTVEPVFTPNGDGYNDTWSIIKSEYFPESLLLIYDRLGRRVFEHYGLYEPWDGRDLFGAPLPDASYFYIYYPIKTDKKRLVKGCVSIVR